MLTRRIVILLWAVGIWGRITGAEEIAWGEAAAGLRVGISCGATNVAVDKQPVFTVRLENVGDVDLIVPAPNSFVPKTHARVIGHFVRPLGPLIETANGRGSTYWITGGEKLASVSKERIGIKAH